LVYFITYNFFVLQKPVGGVAVMPLGADLLSKFRKDKTKEGVAQRPVADVSFPLTFSTLRFVCSY
jgi:hypothetical protein